MKQLEKKAQEAEKARKEREKLEQELEKKQEEEDRKRQQDNKSFFKKIKTAQIEDIWLPSKDIFFAILICYE